MGFMRVFRTGLFEFTLIIVFMSDTDCKYAALIDAEEFNKT